ncbi:MAG: hypothetical protein ABIO04_11185 [Ferruginibacter sp.]
MENVYASYSKVIQNKTYYFVKKFLKFPEFNNVPDVLVGYGMHTDFQKACSIATINDESIREQLLANMEIYAEQAKVIDMHAGTFEIKALVR